MRGIKINYGGVAVGAKENFVPTTTDKADFANINDLMQESTSFVNYGNPCDLYSVALDGNTVGIPQDTESANIGWWSQQISDENGAFANPIVLTLSASDSHYNSSGISLTFDTYNNVYSTSLNVKWYNNDTLLADSDFSPDSAFYFCSNKVEGYNRIVIQFNSINMPFNRLKVRAIDYGMKITFYGDELKSAKIIQEIDPLSSQISINTCDFEICSKRQIEYSFQERQSVEVYFNDKLRSTSFIKTAKRKSQNEWSVQAEDYIGIMSNSVFYGDVYSNKNAVELIEEIFNAANVPYHISDLSSEIVNGYIPYTNCREALMQVAFAVGAVVDTSNSDVVNVLKLSDKMSQEIPLDRIFQGQTFEEDSKITAVEVTSHKYEPSDKVVEAYTNKDGGNIDNVFVKFSQPLHSLTITNGSIVESGTNYAVVNANNECKLTGKSYEHTQTVLKKENPVLTITDMPNVISVSNATLVSADNVAKILEKCYNYYGQNDRVNLKIVEGKRKARYGGIKYGTAAYNQVTDDIPTNVGEKIICQSEYLGDITGIILKQTYNLNGGIIVKDTQMKRGN